MLNILPQRVRPSSSTWAGLSISVLCGFAAGLLLVLQAGLLTHVITQVFLDRAGWPAVSNQVFSLLLVLAARAGLTFGSEASARLAAIQVKSSLRTALAAHLLQLGPAFSTQERSGELVNTITEGVEALDAYFSQYLPQLALAALVPLAVVAFVLPLDLLTAVIFLVTAPLLPLFLWLIGNLSESTTRKQWAILSRLSAHFLDTLQGLTTLKQLGVSREAALEIDRISQRYRQVTLGVLKVAFLSALALELIATLSTAIVAVEISLRLLAGRLEFQSALFILVLAPEFYAPLRALGARFHAGTAGIAAARRIAEILNQPLPSEPAQPAQLPVLPALIRFENVCFSYPGQADPALQDVSFSIQPGQRVAVVGLSGSGKTTLARLLLKFIQPSSGKIWIGGTNLATLPSNLWRDQVAWVPQNPHLFNDTIESNLRLARPSSSPADLQDALVQASLSDFISLNPGGLTAQVGEGGARLSGGEAQRLALARAFLKAAPLLILDEPTSSLDPVLESRFTEMFAQLSQGRSTLIIAHRLSTAACADQVLVLERGRLIQSGDPKELSQIDGPYRGLLQASGGLPL